MKRALKSIIACGLILAMTTGCGNIFSGNKEVVTQTANLFEDNGVTEENMINKGRSEDLFSESIAAALKNQNMTIGMNFTSSYSDDEKLLNDITLKLDYGVEDKKASIKILTNDSGTETTENGYYENGYYYLNSSEGKKKIAEDFGTFLVQNDGYSTNIESSLVSKLACVEKDGVKTYFLQYDPVGYENSLINNMEASSQPLGEDENIVVNYANVVFEVDENNIMKSYTQTTSAVHKTGNEESNYLYNIKVDFYDIGTTNVDVLTDLDTYEEVSDFQAEGSTNENNEVATEN
ncbi:MAG: hypothetical protein ACI4VF_03520 [Lachnospirales bacterium]